MGVLIIRAMLSWVYIRVPFFWKLPCCTIEGTTNIRTTSFKPPKLFILKGSKNSQGDTLRCVEALRSNKIPGELSTASKDPGSRCSLIFAYRGMVIPLALGS